MIKKESIDQLLDSIDIVDLIGSYIELKKTGANFKACCPFHEEKTPSFVVSPQKQIYHCFGCLAGGDAINFVMKHQNLSYPEAIEAIAAHFNFQLEYDQIAPKENKSLELFKNFFLKKLSQNQEATNYLSQRGVYESVIEQFELGFAPSSAEQIAFLKSNNISVYDAQEAGLINKDANNNLYARFTNRIIFPIFSQSGKIVGFGGRTISNHPAKYINSPQTKFFNKSRLLYGYHKAKTSIQKLKQIIIVEGYLDVIMLHQAGFTNALATLGTALTDQHLPILKRQDANIILAYDGDNAGIAAAFKASLMLYKAQMSGGVVLFSQNQDPADMVQQGKDAQLKAFFAKPISFASFIFLGLKEKYNFKITKEKQNALDEIKPFIKSLEPIFQIELARIAAMEFGIKESFFITSQKPNFTNKSKVLNIVELQIIKTLLENKALIPSVKQSLSLITDLSYKELFNSLFSNRPLKQLNGILIDDKISVLSEIELKKATQNLIKHFLKRQIQETKLSKTLPTEEKNAKIKALQQSLKEQT